MPKDFKDLYPAKKNKNKYNAKKVVIDGITFASTKEGKRYQELKFQEHCGVISDLELQPKYILQDKFIHKSKSYRQIVYIGDFRYKRDSETWVEDTKGFKNQIYRIKKKMLLKKYNNINFIET